MKQEAHLSCASLRLSLFARSKAVDGGAFLGLRKANSAG